MHISPRLPTHNLRPSTIAAVSAFLRACARACLLLLEEGTSSRRVRSAVVFRALGSHGNLLFASSKTARVKFFAAPTIRWASVMPRRSCWSSFSGAHQRHVVFPALLKALLSFPELLKVHSCPRLPSHRTSFGALATLGLAPEELAAVRLSPPPLLRRAGCRLQRPQWSLVRCFSSSGQQSASLASPTALALPLSAVPPTRIQRTLSPSFLSATDCPALPSARRLRCTNCRSVRSSLRTLGRPEPPH